MSIAAAVPLTGQLAPAPQIATDNSGNYVVYVVCVDGFSGSIAGPGMMGGGF